LRISLPCDPGEKRKEVTKTVRGERKDAERELRRILREVDAGTFTRPTRRTVGEFLAEWLETTAALRVSRSTLQGYRSITASHLIPLLGAIRLDQLSPARIEAAWVAMGKPGARRDRRGDGGLHPRTILHAHRCLHAALETAVRQGLIARNPAALAEVPRQMRSEVKALDEAQLRIVLDAARTWRGGQLVVPISLSALCALRRGEVCALTWADVNFEDATLAVRRSIEVTKKRTGQKGDGLRFKEPKSGHGRVVAMPKLLATELRRHKAVQSAHRLRLGAIYQNSDLIVANPDGTLIYPDTISHSFRDLIATLDVPRITFHGLRHSAATLMLARGAGVKVVQDTLGHSSPSLTLGTYGHVLKAHQQEAARLMDEALGWAEEKADAI
jgi:integrase